MIVNAGMTVALITLVGASVLGYRSALRWQEYRGWELIARGALLVLLVNIFVAYLDVAADGDGMLWRQWLVAVPLVAFTVAQLGALSADNRKKHRRTP